MYSLSDIESIHMEPTEKCNLSCLMCDRNKNGGEVNQYLKDRELTLDTIARTFSPAFISQLKRMHMCGNYGDPILAKDCLKILKYFRLCNETMKLSVITNGCSRPSKWWVELAHINSTVRFGIDGLHDTHKLYRQGASFDVIINNATSYINAGGYAIWDYLVFGHNEHQIEEARALSEAMGFKEFVVKKTGRFFSNSSLKGKDEHMGMTKPKSKTNINKSLKKEDEVVDKYGSLDTYLDVTKIDCKAIKNKEIYISAEGLIFPCCWTAGQLYKWFMEPKSAQIWSVISKTLIGTRINTLEQIFENGGFDEIEKSWELESIEKGKLKVCALKCGQDLDQFGDQFK